MMEINEMVDYISKICDEECICTPDQETGKDPTVCRRCKASHIYNEIGEILREGIDGL